jgi:hypothetical protein
MHHALDVDTIIERVRGTAFLSRRTIASIAADRNATLEAGIVVSIVGVATALGYRTDVVPAVVAALLGWLMLTGTVWYAADHFMGTPTYREPFQPLARTIGYALAPAALGVVNFIWVLGPMVSGVGTLWSFIATVAAVRYSTGLGWVRGVLLAIAGGIVVNITGFILSIFTGIDPQIW